MSRPVHTEELGGRRAELRVAAAFALSALAALGFVAAYLVDASGQVLGLLLGGAFAALAYGFAAWASDLLPAEVVVEEREPLAPSSEDRAGLLRQSPASARFPAVVRRSLLLAVGALGLAAVVPVRSLLLRDAGPAEPAGGTPWQAGTRLVTLDGDPVRPDDLEVGSVVTAYPEDHVLDHDGVVVLLRLRPDELRLPDDRADWAVGGVVAFSKLCTHVGCPVGLFEQTTRRLLCPCHQSAFDVPRGAVPLSGPAARPLPQLPLEVGPGGFLQARGDFEDLVGPNRWRRV